MRKGGGKSKGSSYERESAKVLSTWISDGQRDDLIWRSTTSGAQFTTYKKQSLEKFRTQAGDLTLIDHNHEGASWFMFTFAQELKFYQDLQIGNLVFGLPSIVGKFWEEHCRLCASIGKIPVLIGKQNRKPELLFLPMIMADWFPDVDRVLLPSYDCVVFPYQLFLSKIQFDMFYARTVRNLGDLPNGHDFRRYCTGVWGKAPH